MIPAGSRMFAQYLSALVRSFAIRDLLDQIDDAAAELGVVDPRKRAGQSQSLRSCEKVGHVSGRSSLAEALAIRPAAWNPFEQERDRDLEDLGNLLDSARTNAVCALFVFLYLLECEAKSLTELFLAHAQHDTAHPHPAADMFVNRVGRFRRHLSHSLKYGLRMRPPQYASDTNTVKFCPDVVTQEDGLSNELTDRTAGRECELRCRSVNTWSFACQKKSCRREKKQECATISQRFWPHADERRRSRRPQIGWRQEYRRSARRSSPELRRAATNRGRPRCRDRAAQPFSPTDRLLLKCQCLQRVPEANLARWSAIVPAADADKDRSRYQTSRRWSDSPSKQRDLHYFALQRRREILLRSRSKVEPAERVECRDCALPCRG